MDSVFRSDWLLKLVIVSAVHLFVFFWISQKEFFTERVFHRKSFSSFLIKKKLFGAGYPLVWYMPFENFFQTVASVHSYNTRHVSKSTYYINTIKTNYGKFNIRFAAVKVWNHLDESIKYLPLQTFKNKVKLIILQSYCS